MKEPFCHQEPLFADLPNGDKAYLTNLSVPNCSWNKTDSGFLGEWVYLTGLSWSLVHKHSKRVFFFKPVVAMEIAA